MKFILEGSGAFIWPLGLCSLLAVYIIVERLISLRMSKVLPRALARALFSDKPEEIKGDKKSTVGRIVLFDRESNPDPEALKAFANFEMGKLERGMFWLDVVISAAPLLGLLGTVAGLVTVFAEATPSPETISRGVGLALSTTIIGLSIAIPSIAGNSYLNNRIDTLCSKINLCVERLIAIRGKRDK